MNENVPYKIGKRVGKDLKKIRQADKKLYQKVVAAIHEIRNNPYIGEAKKGDLKGYYCLDINHVGTNYELCYALEKNDEGYLIVIILMGSRENFYEQLKRYLNK